jgi:succinate dehydrogenase hydrophobic anchor subunit
MKFDKALTKKITAIILALTTVGLLGYDAIIAAGSGTTISQVVWQISAKTPLVPFLVGVVCGHLFWQK